jgi:hypothetical protein
MSGAQVVPFSCKELASVTVTVPTQAAVGFDGVGKVVLEVPSPDLRRFAAFVEPSLSELSHRLEKSESRDRAGVVGADHRPVDKCSQEIIRFPGLDRRESAHVLGRSAIEATHEDREAVEEDPLARFEELV